MPNIKKKYKIFFFSILTAVMSHSNQKKLFVKNQQLNSKQLQNFN